MRVRPPARRLRQPAHLPAQGVEVARLAGLAEAPAAAPVEAATQEEVEGLKQAFFAEQRQRTTLDGIRP